MRHGMKGRKLGRTSSHRIAMFRNQLASLMDHERIITTLPKAKELRPLAEKMVTLGKRSTLHARRQAVTWIPNKTTVKKIFDDISPRFAARAGGYTRIIKLGPRPGDGAEMAVLEFVDYVFTPKAADPGQGETPKAKGSLLERAKAAVRRKPKPGEAVADSAGPAAAAASEGTTDRPATKEGAKKAAKQKAKPVAKKAKPEKPTAKKSSAKKEAPAKGKAAPKTKPGGKAGSRTGGAKKAGK